MFGGDVFILQAVGFFICQIDNPFHARGDKNLPGPAAENVGLGGGTQGCIQPVREGRGVDVKQLKDLGDNTAGLFDQRQQDMLGINLVVPITLDNFGGTLGSFLRAETAPVAPR